MIGLAVTTSNPMIALDPPKLDVIDLGRMDYRAAWIRQRHLHERVVSGQTAAALLHQGP